MSTEDCVAWVIEARLGHGTGNYWTGESLGLGFGEIGEAVRFARKEDAEAVMRNDSRLVEYQQERLKYPDAHCAPIEATEHKWIGPSVAPLLVGAQPPAATREGEKPVATLHDDGHWTWKGTPPYASNFAGWRMEVYAAAPLSPSRDSRPQKRRTCRG